MRHERANFSAEKGWCRGPWNSDLPVAVGYATTGIDEPHLHPHTVEVYLIARGTAVLRVEQETVALAAGDLLIIEPGEAHTFLQSSPEYFHFVIHVAPAGAAARPEKVAVARARLGL